jgi:branched-chain amino acid transport system ATP-binding protein
VPRRLEAALVDGLETFYVSSQALNGVSFEVPDGSIVTLFGANGAGKATTLRTLLRQREEA